MQTLRNYPIEGIIGCMMICEITSIFFPEIIPQSLANGCLLILLICLILVRLHALSSRIKRKYN